MSKNKSLPRDSELRQRAENELETMEKDYDDLSGMSIEQIEGLVHEFRVHRAELKMQNEELRRLQAELETSRDRYLNLYDFSPVGYITVDQHGLIAEVNLTFATMAGFERKKLIGTRISHLIAKEDQPVYYRHRQLLLETQAPQSIELRLIKRDGNMFHSRLESMIATDMDDDSKSIRMAVSDITGRKRDEEVIKAALREKDILLREVHHRVKNNMQVISSLLKLQASRDPDKRVKQALMDCQGRVQVMAAVHEMLHMSNNLAVIDCQTYISKLTGEILWFQNSCLYRVTLIVNAHGVTLPIQQASPLGLIISELLSNALKYGFPENRHGQIMIRLREHNQTNMEFVFSDNGIGIPEDFDWQNAKSLGLNLIVLLAENQLGGTVSLDRGKGTRFTIKFRREEIKQTGQ